MTASEPKYYFRKKSKNLRELSNRVQHNSSSTESDEQAASLADDSSRITLHVITEKGQSDAVKKCFTRMTQLLDPTFDVVCVSERTNSNKMKNKRTNLPAPKVPALAVILFFMCDIAAEDPAEVAKHRASDSDNSDDPFKVDTEKRKNAFHEVRRAFSKKPWRFHHKVAVSGKLLCDSNVQDYFEFESSSQRRGSNGRVTPSFNENVQLPLWAVRRVHYGKQILRFNIFVSYENWEPQVELYTLILKAEGVRVRDDFCYFETFSNLSSVIQIGLKRLPTNLKPQRLRSSILQFKVQNVGQLVPLLPHPCEPISELRWRTRDHDSNLILLQIKLSHGGAPELALDKVLSDSDIVDERSKTPIPRCGTPKPSIPVPRPRTIRYFETSTGSEKTHLDSSPNSKRDFLKPEPNDYRSDDSALGDSFICPSLPDKMPLIKSTLYNVDKPQTVACQIPLSERLRNNKLLKAGHSNSEEQTSQNISLNFENDVTKPNIIESEEGDIYI